MDGRYSRQTAFYGIGEAGQRKLSSARVAIVGLGALGTAAADRLCRAGIGYLRLIDGDAVELSNLQRQSLYSEADLGKPKAETSVARLREINSEITVTPLRMRIEAVCDPALSDVDLVLDCTDNAAVRYIINETCRKFNIPWIHGAAAGSTGSVFAVVPGGACFRCLYPDTSITEMGDTAATLGMLNSLTAIVGALEAGEAIKALVGAPTSGLMMFDVWSGVFEFIETQRDPACPVCAENGV
jgi:adenylyltransferase/sulfurtransferase